MYRLKKQDVRASEIAAYLNQGLQGEDFYVTEPGDLLTPGIRLGRTGPSPERDAANGYLVIAPEPLGVPARGFIRSLTPELDLAGILAEFFVLRPIHAVHPTAQVDPEARIGRDVMIGAHSVVGPDVEVGDHVRILCHVVLNGPVRIGAECVIKDGAVIGSEGWLFLEGEDGRRVHPPQLGRVLLGDRVWVGSNATIERAMLEPTVIEADAKIDDLVHIGGGTIVGPQCEITAGTVVARQVRFGRAVRVAPQAVIRERLRIGDGAVIGQGAVVVNDLEAGVTYVGNPARPLKKARA